MQKIKILLADDHAVLRSGLKLLLNNQPDLMVVGEVGDGSQVVEAVLRHRPDVLLLDLAMPGLDGISIIKELRRQGDQTKILVLTMHEEEGYLMNVIQAGGDGYILKKAADTELLSAIRMVAQGMRVYDPLLAGMLVSRLYTPERDYPRRQDLSEREKEVLRLIALGYTTRQIAEELSLSIKTVETHKAHIKAKLNLTNRSELVRYAIDIGLI